ncbi:MAG: hypothetical protein GZ094_22330, partial [Mariniphaga sp.]|nr:hypothetical protein [Mariniphaga sp.]
MDENKLYKSLIICVLVLAGLSLGAFFPRINVAGFELKSVDLFSDLRSNYRKNAAVHNLQANQSVIFDLTYLPYLHGFTHYLTASGGISPLLALPNFGVSADENEKRFVYRFKDDRSVSLKSIAELLAGPVLFEDFSPEGRSMKQFFKELGAIKRGEEKGRIAFFGDSFIEGDIFCSDVRNSLQDLFGGNGVGFVPITSEVAQFRSTIGHTFTGFRSYSLVKNDSVSEPFGAGGYCFTAGEDNDVTYSVNPKYKHLNLFRDIRLFYTSPENTTFNYSLNNNGIRETKIFASDRLQQEVFNDVNATTVSFIFPVSDTIKLYGVSFEDALGIYVDNFSLRGNSGLALSRISESMNRQFNQFQNYQLIILQYGLNVIAADTKDLSWYVNPMINVIQRLKRCYPDAAILLMSVSDRSTNVGGEYQTMESVPLMVEAQREIARQSQVAFYNLYE